MPAAEARIERDGEALRFAGALDRAAAATLWPRALPLLGGVRRFDLGAVSAVDSAGLALLAELAARAGGGVTLAGHPPGLAALGEAYRLDAGLGYAS
jgi:phospholipid transport system transporter-binding protein